MAIFSRLIFAAIQYRAKRGLSDVSEPCEDHKDAAQKRGIRGETFAYWYLRRHGYVFVARNFVPRGAKGEIDLIGYDGATLVFVEVRTRTAREQRPALAELSVTPEKQHLVTRTAQRFLRERHAEDCPIRFDVVAIEEVPGNPPRVRLYKNAFGPAM
jgi:putative endonuclease